MKKYFISSLTAFLLSLCIIPLLAEDITTPLFATFEDGNPAPFVLNADGPGSDIKGQVIDDNPAQVLNLSSKCIRVDKPGNLEWWHKTYLKIQDGTKILPQTPNHQYLHFFIKYPSGGSGVEICVLKGDGTTTLYQRPQVDFPWTTSGWYDVVINLSGKMDETGIGGFWIRPFYGSSTTFYLDEFELSDSYVPRIKTIAWNSPVWATFESEDDIPFTFAPEGGTWDLSANNPDVTGINNTAKCLFADFSSGINGWDKAKIHVKQDHVVAPQSPNYKYLHFFTYYDREASTEVHLYQGGEKEQDRIYQKRFTVSTTNVWVDNVLDLSASGTLPDGAQAAAYSAIEHIWISPDLSNWSGGPAGHFYFDDFVLSNDPTLRTTSGLATKTGSTIADVFRYYVNNGEVYIIGKDIALVEVYGINGVLLQSKSGDGSISLPFFKGLYILKVYTKDKQSYTRKIAL